MKIIGYMLVKVEIYVVKRMRPRHDDIEIASQQSLSLETSVVVGLGMMRECAKLQGNRILSCQRQE